MTTNVIPSIFDTCTPRQDILDGNFEVGLAADLSLVAEGKANSEYVNPVKFFAGTYPTNGIKTLLKDVLKRLNGQSQSACFWLDTSFGGGKTHALIALLHAVRLPPPDTISEFTNPALLPKKRVKLAIFDGYAADISSGHDVGGGVRARTPWGEIAYRLGGKRGYDRVDDSESASAPGTDTIRDLFGDEPVLILLDELSVYLRKAKQHKGAEKQFTAFFSSLINAAENSSNVALIFTLAVGKGEKQNSGDAYASENQQLSELQSVASRKAIILNPTEEGETIQVLKRRLFVRCDEDAAKIAMNEYKKVWNTHHDKLSDVANDVKTTEEFLSGYPLHPEILKTLISKTSTLENFQRIRGMLRLLGHVVYEMWQHQNETPRPILIHLHHFDVGKEKIRDEITTRAKQRSFVPAIDTDVACDTKNKTSLAQRLDKKYYPNMHSFTTYVARTILMHSLASLKQLKGIDDKNLRYSILQPNMEISYIDDALIRFKNESLYLDDNPEKPTQFQEMPNLNKTIRQTEQNLEESDLENEIDRRIIDMFSSKIFDVHLFPKSHADIDDSVEKPKLIVLKYSEVSISNPTSPPDILDSMFTHKGTDGFRINRNNMIFVTAHDNGIELMRIKARAYLARAKLSESNNSSELAEYQKDEIKRQKTDFDKQLDSAIFECYKYVHYPHKNGKLDHTVVKWKNNNGESQIIESLRNANKIRTKNDESDNPRSLLERIHEFNTKGKISTQKFREEFYRNSELPLLIGDTVFFKGIKRGINDGVFVYEKGDLICGKGDADFRITIDADSFVYSMDEAKRLDKWPPKIEDGQKTRDDENGNDGGDNLQGTRGEPEMDVSTLETDGKPSEAICKILQKLQEFHIHKITKMQIESKDDVFSLLLFLDKIREIKVNMVVNGDYKVHTTGTFRFEYEGGLDGTEEEREFLRNQLRNTDRFNMHVALNVDFGNDTLVNYLKTFANNLESVEIPIKISQVEGTTND